MAAFRKASAELTARFDANLPKKPGVERRQMFGYANAFVNGNMFAGLFEDSLVVRVPEEAAAHPFTVMGKTMREYAAIDGAMDLSPAAFAKWMQRGYGYAAKLPPKKPRKPKAAARRAGR